jgi:hypothetical protein
MCVTTSLQFRAISAPDLTTALASRLPMRSRAKDFLSALFVTASSSSDADVGWDLQVRADSV